MELVPEMAELDLFGANIDEYGLPGLNNVAYGLIMQELERGDSGLRSFVSVQSALVMYPIYTFGSQEQRDRWIPPLASGEAIGCFGLTEPDFGSNPGGMRTTARRDGDGWVLNGAKQWITNGTLADVAVVWAQTEEGIRGFLVEKGTPGYTSSDQHGKFSLRASVTSELGFQDCRIPADAILPEDRGAQERPDVSEPGALRHRLGRPRRRHGLLPTPPSTTPRSASSSVASRSPATSWSRRSSSGCSPRSPRDSCSCCSSAG